MGQKVRLELTPIQARVLFDVVDGQSDAGACEGGNTPREQRALYEISTKLLDARESWKHVSPGK